MKAPKNRLYLCCNSATGTNPEARRRPALGDKLDRMPRPKLLLLYALCAWCGAASAQWAWRDAQGNRVFSDRPPPPGIASKDILRQPAGGGRAVPLEVAPPAASAPSKPAASAAAAPAQDKELEAKKKQADDAEAARKKAAADKLAKDRAENCNRARQAKATYDSGIRVGRTNAQGEREILDDAARAAETQRLQGVIDSDCK